MFDYPSPKPYSDQSRLLCIIVLISQSATLMPDVASRAIHDRKRSI